MAYTPHTWQCGELVTDDDMNRIEEGIQEALECCDNKLVVTASYQYDEQTEELQWVADHSAEEIMEAYNQGKTVIARREVEGAVMIYRVSLVGISSNYNYIGFTHANVGSDNFVYVETISIDDFGGDDKVIVRTYTHQDTSNT